MRVEAPVNDTSRRRRMLWISLAVAVALVLTAGAAAIAWAIGTNVADSLKGTPDDTEIAATTTAPDAEQRRAFYSFGHTSQTIQIPVAAPAVIEQRLPFRPTVEASRYRVVIRNLDYRDDAVVRNPVTLHSVYLGGHEGDGLFDTASTVRLEGEGRLIDGDAVTTGWFDASTLPLGPDKEFLLGISFSAPTSTQIGLAPGVGWVRSGVSAGSMADADNVGDFNRVGTYLDVSIEYAFDDPDNTVPVVAVIGHSLNSGANENPEVDHEGETSSWHQIWARDQGGAASSLAAVGAWTANFLPDSPKWALSRNVDADYVAIWSSSSDLVSGAALDDVGVAWLAVIEQARRAWPQAKIVAFTEPPRGASGEGEALRVSWNDFLRLMPEHLDILVDIDEIVADTKDPSVLSGQYDGDGSHMNPAGNAVVADAFAEALRQFAEETASDTESASE